MSKWGEMTAEYEWGFEKGVDTERERILDLIADQNCGHKGCRECGTYEFLLDLITLKERLQ